MIVELMLYHTYGVEKHLDQLKFSTMYMYFSVIWMQTINHIYYDGNIYVTKKCLMYDQESYLE